MRVLATLALALMLPAAARAQGPLGPPTLPRPWAGEGEVAYLKSSGSSRQQTFKGFSYTRYQQRDWTHELRLEGLNEANADTGRRTRERYFVLEKTSWSFTPRDYLFLRPQHEKDLQSAYEYQAVFALGYGHQFLKTDTLFLNLDLGAGVRHSKLNVTGDSDDDPIGNLASKLEWKFRPGARLTEDVALDAGNQDNVLRTRSALILALSHRFGLVIAYETKRDDGPVRVRDSLLSAGLNYQLK